MNETDSAVCRAIDANLPAMGEMLTTFVAMPTENPPATDYAAFVTVLQSALDRLGLVHERVDVQTTDGCPRPAVFAWLGDAGPTLYFHGHYDVVPASEPSQFLPRLEGGVLFGRGSSDMKGGLVSMIAAAVALQTASRPFRGRVGLVFVPDEETGGELGSSALAEAGLLGRDAIGMLLPEPTSGRVWNAHRGALSLEVTVKGRPAHVGLQHLGINAFEHAVSIANQLFALKRQVETHRTSHAIQPTEAGASILLIGGQVSAGVNFNSVPGACVFTVDRRTNPEEDFQREKERLFAVLDNAKAAGIDFDVRVLQEGRSSSTAPDTPLGLALTRSIEGVTGSSPQFEVCPGLLENRFYAERGVPSFAYGPGILAVSHGPQEFVKMERVADCAKVYALTANRVFDLSTHPSSARVADERLEYPTGPM